MRHKPILLRRSLLAGGALLAAPSIVRAQGTNGVALVIGNSKYQWEAQLGNVKRDAPDIAKAFQAKGLKTELLQDLTRDAFQQAVSKFKAAASGANLAAFYYAGHGASWDKDTYLVPVDADLSTPNVVKTLLPVRDVTAAMKGAANRLLVFDSCRNNPADGWRQTEAEQAAVQNVDMFKLPENTLTLYSTTAGRIALDGPPNGNSPFATSILRELYSESFDLWTLAAKIRRNLLLATEGKQLLWSASSFRQSFVVNGSYSHVPGHLASQVTSHSHILEVPKAYAYAHDKKFYIPEGLIGYRPIADSILGRMIGSYTFSSFYTGEEKPNLIIVLSARKNADSEIIVSGISEIGKFWRHVSAKVVNETLEFTPREKSGLVTLKWDRAHGGTVTIYPRQQDLGKKITTTPFTRLDG